LSKGLRRYFARELDAPAGLGRDGSASVGQGWISASMKGRLLIRNVCRVFDQYLNSDEPRHSKTL
jgi:oxygen-independent coproporphyrinogen-3 oxidase